MKVIERIEKYLWEPKIERLITEAGHAILGVYEKNEFEKKLKKDSSPVTSADLHAHQLIITGLSKLSADVPIISEESFEGLEKDAIDILQNKEAFWLVDPLDGTKEFIAQNGEFTVNIALIEHGKPVAGWIYVPTTAVLYKAVLAKGSWKKTTKTSWSRIETRALSPISTTFLVSRSHAMGEARSIADVIPDAEIKKVGSSLKYVLLAEGHADFCLRRTPTHIWDTAAADIILSEAGGCILDWDQRPLSYSQGITNPPFLALGDPKSAWQSLLKHLL